MFKNLIKKIKMLLTFIWQIIKKFKFWILNILLLVLLVLYLFYIIQMFPREIRIKIISLSGQVLQLIGVILVLLGVYFKSFSKLLLKRWGWVKNKFNVFRNKKDIKEEGSSTRISNSVKGNYEIISSKDNTIEEQINLLKKKIKNCNKKIRNLENKYDTKFKKIKQKYKKEIETLKEDIDNLNERINGIERKRNEDHCLELSGAVWLIIGIVLSIYAEFNTIWDSLISVM